VTEQGKVLAKTVIDRPVAGAIALKTSGGLIVKNVGEAMEIAKLMSISGAAVPAHIRNNAGACLAVAIQAWEWEMNPFAVANKSYVVNDRLAYESALYNAVATRRAPIEGRLQISYAGEGPSRQCMISAQLKEAAGGGDVEYKSPQFSQINPKNSPLWKNDPDQQLFYFSVRAFVRRHFPDVMMGVYTDDELEDAAEPVARQGARRKLTDEPAAPGEAANFGGMDFGVAKKAPDAPAPEPPATKIDPSTGEETPATPDAKAEAPKQGQRRRLSP